MKNDSILSFHVLSFHLLNFCFIFFTVYLGCVLFYFYFHLIPEKTVAFPSINGSRSVSRLREERAYTLAKIKKREKSDKFTLILRAFSCDNPFGTSSIWCTLRIDPYLRRPSEKLNHDNWFTSIIEIMRLWGIVHIQ